MVKSVWLSTALAALVAFPVAASAGWMIEWKHTSIRNETRQDSKNATAYMDGNKSRMEQEHLTTIYDYGNSKFTIINPESKYFWSGTDDEYVKLTAKRRQEKAQQNLGVGKKKDPELLPEIDEDSLPEISVVLSGETREIAGHQTTKYLVMVGEELFQEVWVAPDLDLSSDLDPKKFIEYQQTTSRGMVGRSSKAYQALYRSPAYLDLLRKGFALETLSNHLAGSFERSARSVRQIDVEPSKFAVPEGYRRVRLSDVFDLEKR